MTRKCITLALVSTMGTLLGCAQLGTGQPSAPARQGVAARTQDALPVKVAAVPAAMRLAETSNAESAYLLGRAAHGAGQLAEARSHYARVLAVEPSHVGALNAMAVIHAQEGRIDDALALFGKAMAVAPQAAHLHNNAGYALLRAGRLDEAETALLRAQGLDPANLQIKQNLGLLRTAQARAGKGAEASVQQQVQADERSGPATEPRVVVVAPQVYALQPGSNSNADGPPVATVHAIHPASPSLRGARVEVSNGVGITRLARRTADRLASTGLVAARLTNAKPYRQVTTEIQFRAGQEQMAQTLKAHLPVAAKVVAIGHLQPGIQMRLVLGQDLAGKAITAWLDQTAQQLQPVASLKDDGWVWG